jgi:hypothetical protein
MSTQNTIQNAPNEAAAPVIKIMHNAQNLVKSGGTTLAVHLTPETRSMWCVELARSITEAKEVKTKFKGGEPVWEAANEFGIQVVEQVRTYINASNKQFSYGAMVVQKKELTAAIVATMQAIPNLRAAQMRCTDAAHRLLHHDYDNPRHTTCTGWHTLCIKHHTPHITQHMPLAAHQTEQATHQAPRTSANLNLRTACTRHQHMAQLQCNWPQSHHAKRHAKRTRKHMLRIMHTHHT